MKTNHWSQIRKFAREMRKKMLEANGGKSSPDLLLAAIASETKISSYGLPAKDPLLYKAQAILHSNIVFFDNSLAIWQTHFNRMHEYAHHFLKHGSSILCRKDDFNPEASEDAIAFGEQRVEGYGPHERRELEANLFAREFFLPCDELRDCFLAGKNADLIALKFEMPSGMVIHQLMRAVLGFEAEISPESIAETTLAPEEFDLDGDQQKAAYFGNEAFKTNDFELPVLVDAGPGTGKTRTLTARIAHLINDREILPETILALTYSNKAAEEMYSRVNVATAHNASKIWMGTFHRFCLELIRKYHYLLNISAKPQVADAYDVQILLEQSLERLNLKHYRSLARPSANFKRILDSISRAKDELVSPEEYRNFAQTDLDNAPNNKQKRGRAEKDLEIATAYSVYQEVLAENNLLDYGDLLFLAVDLLRKNDSIREEIQKKYRYILIDEYQDVNTASRELLKLVAGDGSGLWVVGDIRQAIYRFRGAAPTNMLLLTKEDYPNAEVLQLSINYRAKQKIVDAFTYCCNQMKAKVEASRVARWNVFRKEDEGEVNFVEADDEFDEAHEIVETVKRLYEERKISYQDQAILCRSHDDLVHYSAALEEAGVPVLYLGDFFERPEIRDLLCVIDLASGMEGRAVYRFAAFEEYAFPFAETGILIKHALENNRKFPGALKCAAEIETLSEQAKTGLGLMTAHIADYHPNSSSWTVLSQYLFSRSNYLRLLLKSKTPQTMQRRLAIYQLLLLTYQLRDKFEDDGDSKKHFLNYIRQLKRNNDDKAIRQTPHWADAVDAIKMLTIHAAKGLEFKVVHLPALSDGKFFAKTSQGKGVSLPSGILKPEMSGWAAEEEECLFFVALSRAGDILNIYRANQY
ncbi:MAG: UvrD-helicase domain-containing protein, partial [Pyrinomonadaceae bacterium]